MNKLYNYFFKNLEIYIDHKLDQCLDLPVSSPISFSSKSTHA
jgi:hypothetical protein